MKIIHKKVGLKVDLLLGITASVIGFVVLALVQLLNPLFGG
ncbi:hypothetical protein [Viridibacillus arvi]